MDVMDLTTTESPNPLLQGLWDGIRTGQEERLQSLYLPAFCAFFTHVALCLPFLVLDTLGGVCQRVSSWRIAAKSKPPPSLRRWLYCFCSVLYKYITVILPATALFQSLRTPNLPEVAPSCWRLFVEVTTCLLLFDALFYFWHYIMHRVPWLYRSVHQMHHQYHIPFALAAQDASPAELLSQLLLALSIAWTIGCHPLSELLFHLLNTWLAVVDHCGYNFSWSVNNMLPCLGGAPHHQTHHSLPNTNFAPYFTHWDRLFGTYRSSATHLHTR